MGFGGRFFGANDLAFVAYWDRRERTIVLECHESGVLDGNSEMLRSNARVNMSVLQNQNTPRLGINCVSALRYLAVYLLS